jgi:coenzyme F430 synthetase
MDFGGKNVAVLDTIHGGRQICKKLREIGAVAVAINIYHDTPTPDVIDTFDVVITPVHAHSVLAERAEALGIPVITHHQAVGQLVQQTGALEGALVFEVTGVKGKTTTASLLGNAYSDRRLLTLTSRGLELHENGRYIAKKRLSITPASILTAMDLITEFDFNPEVCVFEVSLGGTGLADINVLTTLWPEYGIAQHTKTSTFAKLQMIANAKTNSCLIASIETASLAERASCLNTFGESGATVRYDNISGDEATIVYTSLERMDGSRVLGEVRFALSGSYDVRSYEDALLCFTTAALSAGLSPEAIERTLSDFKGVLGRMSAATIEGRFLVDNSNSGLDELSIKEAIRYGLTFKKAGHKVVLVIGEEAKNVCNGIAPEALVSLAENDALDHVVLVGDHLNTFGKGVVRTNSLESALRKALALTDARDVIISCVKMWR